MTQFNIQTTKFANILSNAVALSDGPAATPGFESILIALEGKYLSVYGMGRHTAGVSRLELDKNFGEATVCIDRSQADALQSAVRKCGSAQSAMLIVEIIEDGRDLEMCDDDGNMTVETVHFIVTFEDEMLCAIPDSDPEARGGCFWDHIDEITYQVEEDAEVRQGPVAFGVKTLAVLNKLKPPVDRVDLCTTSIPEVVAVKHGIVTVLMGTVGRRKDDIDLWQSM